MTTAPAAAPPPAAPPATVLAKRAPTKAQLAAQRQDGFQLMIALEDAGGMSGVGLHRKKLAKLITKDEDGRARLIALLTCFGYVHKGSKWAIGDAILFAEDLFGEEYADAIESTAAERYDAATRVTGLSIGTIQNIVSVCKRVPIENRVEGPAFAIYEDIAALDPPDQKRWLDLVVENGWTRSELRAAMKEEGATPEDPPPAPLKDDERLTPCEQIEAASRLVYTQAQRTSDGQYLVPGEAFAQLGSAIGED